MIITSNQKQTTIKKEVEVRGLGLHTGVEVCMTLKPAKENYGYVFVRTDLDEQPQIPANAQYVSDIQRNTILQRGDAKIMTCEHILAALVGCEIDNIIIELDQPELPIMDGSSKYFVEMIEEAGIEEQKEFREEYVIQKQVSYVDEKTGSEITIYPSDEYQITTMIDFGTQILGTQNAQIKKISDFKKEISNSRTFCFLHELESLLENNLIKGGDLSNAIVYIDREPSAEIMEKVKKLFKKDNINVTSNGILDNLKLHHFNEAARHKLLDVIGDLSLVGMRIRGHVVANKPGHFVNTEFAKILAKDVKSKQRHPEFYIDLDKPPVCDINDIMKRLPHRPPFLLLDRVMELSESYVVGVKNVTMNEAFFIGHFPDSPVMPGVLQIEAMAQAGGVLVLGTVPDPENYLTYFTKIDAVKFKKQVIPGDTLVFCLKLLSPIRRGICHMKGHAFVNGKLVTEAELMAQIVKHK